MQSRWHRVIGAGLFSIMIMLIVFGRPALRGEGADLGTIMVSLLVAAAVAYRAWPGLCLVWATRDRADDWRRIAWIAAGVLLGFVLGDIVPALLGPHFSPWIPGPFVLIITMFVVLTVTTSVQTRRGR